nr:putative late blight resistance protein homolog R1B-17 [Ipomoea batatas]GME20352.1 putative late blight resistance protein homolog R1B-17 [Ipomoea batatas]
MAFLAVISLMRTVELQFLHPQPRIILTNKEQIKSLHEKLGHLLVFLEECEKKGNNCAEMKELIDKIRKVSVKAEDDIEAELLNVHHLQRVVEDIEELMQTTRNTNHHLVNNLTLGDPSQPTSNVVEDNAMVGHSEELDEVKSQLFRDSLKQRQVMAMVGMGGIGKTTFAKRIYNDPLVASHFKFRAWTTLTQEHNKLQALTDLIRCILPMSNKKIGGDKRWLSVKVVNPHFHLAIASRKCRTIVCFNMVGNCDYEWYLLANSFKKLRVLDLSKINFSSGMPPDITQLVFLRYLEIASSKVLNCIPLWKNWNLQTLIVTEDDNGARRLPPGIWDLPQLRHLEINHQVPIVGLPKMVQENLQTLYWLSTSQCTMEVFMRIPNVKDLRIIARCQVSSSQGLNDNLKCLNHLEKLRVRGSYHPLHLPSQGDIFPQNLKELTFERTLIPWEAMTIISLLPNLEILKLKNFACVGQEWQLIEEGSFPQLKVLLISLTNLKEWKAYVESPFPNLEHLLLRNCFELKEMPEWIADIITLQLIKLENCYSSLVTSAMTVKEDQLDNYGNDKLDVLDFHTRPDEDHVGAEEEEYSNEQISGKECAPNSLRSLWFEARKLRIPGSEEPRYWSWTLDSTTGYEVAELLQMSWFEIGFTCDIRCLSKMTCYSAYLVFKLVVGGFQDVNTALTCVRYSNDKNLYGKLQGQNRNSQVFLAKTKSYGDCGQFPIDDRCDGWMEIKLGDFYVSSGNEGAVEFLLWHVSDQYWLSGFVVKGIEVRPVN